MKNAQALAVNLSLTLVMLVVVPFGSATSGRLTGQQIRQRIIAIKRNHELEDKSHHGIIASGSSENSLMKSKGWRTHF